MKKTLIIILICNAINITMQAQEIAIAPITKKLQTTVFIGMPVTIHQLPNFAMGISVNPTYRLGRYFSAEAQASFTHLDFCQSNSFFGHAQGALNFANLLIGPRFYWNSPAKRNRVYSNALIGYGYLYETRTLVPDVNTDNTVTISLGSYIEIKNKFVIGASLEGALGHLEFRAGYKF